MTDPRTARSRRRRVIVTGALVAVATLAGCSAEDSPDPNRSNGAESANGGEYTGVDEPCEALDPELFAQVVGARPDRSDETTKTTDHTASMYCQLSLSEVSGRVSEFAIDVRSRVHPDADAAVGEFENAMGLSSTDVESMTEVAGSWERAVSLVVDESGQYLLLVQDGNLAIGVTANVEPFDGVAEKDVVELMVEYAEQTMADLTK